MLKEEAETKAEKSEEGNRKKTEKYMLSILGLDAAWNRMTKRETEKKDEKIYAQRSRWNAISSCLEFLEGACANKIRPR